MAHCIGIVAASCVIMTGLLTGKANAFDPQPLTTDGGTSALLLADPSLPIVTLRFEFAGGAGLDPEVRAGLTMLTGELLDEGAGNFDGRAFQERLIKHHATLDMHVTKDALVGLLKVRRDDLDDALHLIRLMLHDPQFAPAAVERVKSQMIAAGALEREDPVVLARQAWWRRQFSGDPYGNPIIGTAETLEALTRADVLQQYERMIDRRKLAIAIVGDLNLPAARAAIAFTFDALPTGRHPPPGPTLIPAAAVRVDVEAASARHIVAFGQSGVRMDDADYPAARLLVEMLGGLGETSCLGTEIRHKRGLAYFARAGLMHYQRADLLFGVVGVRKGEADTVVDIIKDCWRRWIEVGPSLETIKAAKAYLKGAFWLNIESDNELAEFLIDIQRFDLGTDFADAWSNRLDTVGEEDLRRVARNVLRPDQLSFVILGQ